MSVRGRIAPSGRSLPRFVPLRLRAATPLARDRVSFLEESNESSDLAVACTEEELERETESREEEEEEGRRWITPAQAGTF